MSFVKRALTVTFTLNNGNFQGTNSNSLTLSGLRISLRLSQAGGVSKDASQIVIFGLSQSLMNQLSIYGIPSNQNLNNKVSISAGDKGGKMSQVFLGTIQNAYADYTGSPDPAFIVTSFSVLYEAVATVATTSAPGSVDVGTLLSPLAKMLGMTLENNGVTVKLSSHYSTGSALDQVKAIARAGNFNAYPDTVRKTLAIWPQNMARMDAGQMTLISPATGLLDYPTFGVKAIMFRTIYNPSIVFGRKINLQSSLKPATGIWVPMQIDTRLDSEMPGGFWEQHVYALSPGTTS